MKHLRTACTALAIAAITTATLFNAGCCSESSDDNTNNTAARELNTVRTVNYPLAYFAERIGGDVVNVIFDLPDGDPAFWEPTADDVKNFQNADMILLNGATYAKWIDVASLPRSKCINTSAAFRDRYIETVEDVEHSHGMEGDHSHGGTAFTTWLDPTLAIEQAAAIRDAFIAARPDDKALFEDGFNSLAKDIGEFDSTLEALLLDHIERPLIGSHPVYQYFTRRYGLNLVSVMWEPDAEPSEEQWAEFDKLHAGHAATVMLWEDAPLESTRAGLEARGITCLIVQHGGNRPEQGDWMRIMWDNAAELRRLKSIQ